MKNYKIEIKEFLSKIIEIKAENIQDAISEVKIMYQNEEIILNSDDYIDTEINGFIE